jgi:hypothetical protein
MTTFVSNNVFTSQLAISKGERLDKKVKDEKIREVIGFLRSLALEDPLEPDEENHLRSYRFSYKLEKQRIGLVFDFTENNFGFERTFSKLQIGEETFFIGEAGTRHILRWMQYGEGAPFIKCNGNRLESVDFRSCKPCEDSYWNDWKTSPDNIPAYRNGIYPVCLTYLEELTKRKPYKILEICGGDGEFASQALSKLGDQVASYTLVDRNGISLSLAHKRFSQMGYHKKVLTIQSDILSDPLPDEHFDMVIGIGAITRGVLPSRNAGLRVLRKIVAQISLDGFLLLSGLGEQWICSEDLSAAGLSVKNMFCEKIGKQLYLAQKTKSSSFL